MRSLTRSLSFSILSISTLTRRPPTFSTRRILTVWMMSRVSGSIAIGPRGLSHFMPLAAPMSAEVGKRSEEHTSELQSHSDLVCRLLLEKKHTHHPAGAGGAAAQSHIC